MARLSTEMILEILGYMSMAELKVIGLISSKYRSLALPFLFHRICVWKISQSWTVKELDLIMCL
jgi:hypothetical protein